MVNSDRKGKVGERELANKFKAKGEDTRRGQQHDGLEGEDVVGLEHIHIECKRVETFYLRKSLKQSIKDAEADQVPVVMQRSNNEDWVVVMDLDDWYEMYQAWRSLKNKKQKTLWD